MLVCNPGNVGLHRLGPFLTNSHIHSHRHRLRHMCMFHCIYIYLKTDTILVWCKVHLVQLYVTFLGVVKVQESLGVICFLPKFWRMS